ncbi:MAG: hypothetical protein ACRD0C_14470, partial [Acidimicrobiia bacterium]
MTGRVVASGLHGVIGMHPVPARGVVAFCEWQGQLNTVDPSSGTVTVIGRGYRAPESVVVTADGSTAFVSERGGEILTVDLAHADRADALLLAGGLSAPHQLVLSQDEKHLLGVEFAHTGRLIRVDLASGAVDVLSHGIEWAVGLAVDAGGSGTAFVTEQRHAGGRLTRIDLYSGTTETVLDGLVAPFFVSWLDETMQELVLLERDPANRLTIVEAATGNVRRQVDGLPFRPSGAARHGDRLLVGCDRVIVELDVSHGLVPEVHLDMPGKSMFVGGYARVPVDLGTSGLGFDDLRFEVVDGPLAGSVSLSRDATFDPARPEIMLLGGSEPGTWTLVATEAATGAVVGEGTFTTTAEWTDDPDGPPIAFVGRTESFVAGAAWGGGPAGLQNVNVFPATGTRRVAVILVDTSSARYPGTGLGLPPVLDDPLVTAFKTEWQGELMGTLPDPDLVVRSTRGYFQEVSAGRYDLALVGGGVAGPFHLPGSWDDYFTWDPQRFMWLFNGNLPQACVTAAQAQIDFDQVDTLVMVMNSVPAVPSGAARYAWPAANGGNLTYTRPGQTTPTQRAFPYLVMPVDWELVDAGGRRIHETLAHEIGHNLGMGDLYMNLSNFSTDMQARDVKAWDLMSWENPLPHVSLAHRMMLGWVHPSWIRPFNFANSTAVDETLTLQAVESIPQSGPPAGRWAGIEVRRAAGWNYYFEYRAGQINQFGDRALPADRRVFGSDVISPTFTAPQVRRQIIMLPDDPDGDGPVLGPGADYEEADVSGPSVQVDVVSTATDSAVVRIRYGAGGVPDPSIRPWPGGSVWQSPDIEVRNARNAADPAWFNVPWAGHPNTVVAKVTNTGTFPTAGVRVDFAVKDYTLGNAPETPIGEDVHDVAVGATVEFTTAWNPPPNTPTDDAHYCVIARIAPYQDPVNSAIVELTDSNNLAQSNYTRFISASASPSTRGMTSVTLTNPYPEPTRVFVLAQQSTTWYRTYVEHQWVWLGAGEERSVGVMYESLAGDPVLDLPTDVI